MKNSTLILLLFTVLLSCKKNNTGGVAVVKAHVGHHSQSVKGATVYVKFNTKEAPVSPENNYDLKIEGEAVEDHVHIQGLRYGDYYLYAVGYDSILNQVVKGGVPLKINWGDRKKEVEIDIPVTE